MYPKVGYLANRIMLVENVLEKTITIYCCYFITAVMGLEKTLWNGITSDVFMYLMNVLSVRRNYTFVIHIDVVS